MNIVFTIPHMTIGGAQKVVYYLVNWLQNNTSAKIHLIIYSKNQIGEVAYDMSGISYTYLPQGTFNKIKVIRRFLKESKTDLLVSMGITNVIYDVPSCMGLRTKHIVCERNDPNHFAGRMVTRLLSRFLMKMADAYIFQTKEAQSFYGEDIAKRSKVIPNPLFNLDLIPKFPFKGIREKIVVATGRLNKQKNHALLIKAFAKVSNQFVDYNLVIYGDGPERRNDEKLIESLGLKGRVLLPGSINNVLETIYPASLYVMSSDFEGMPNALMEAMALGLPCISTDCPCGGPRELIDNGNNGILVKVGNEQELASAIFLLLSDYKRASEIGMSAMKIRDYYSIDVIAQKWFDYFTQLIKNNNRH